MNPIRSFSTVFLATLLGGCHLCVGFPTKWRCRAVGADDGDARDSAGPENVAYGLFCLLAIVFTIITLPSPRAATVAADDASDARAPESTERTAATADAVPAADPARPRSVEPRNSQTKPDVADGIDLAITDDAEPDNNQDLLLSAIHHLTTFHGNDCSDILLCAEEPIWDDTMDEALCDILSCAAESMRDSSFEQSAHGSDGGASIADEVEEAEEAVVAEGKYRDLMSLYRLQDPVRQGLPAMSPIDSVVSISNNSFCSSSSLGSNSLTSRTRTRKMSPQPNAEWAIME